MKDLCLISPHEMLRQEKKVKQKTMASDISSHGSNSKSVVYNWQCGSDILVTKINNSISFHNQPTIMISDLAIGMAPNYNDTTYPYMTRLLGNFIQ